MTQDFIFMIGGFIFILALIPTLRSPDKPPIKTSLTTGSVLAVFAVCYLTLDLMLAFTTTAATAVMWLAIAYQRYQQKQNYNRLSNEVRKAQQTSKHMILTNQGRRIEPRDPEAGREFADRFPYADQRA